MIHWITDYGQFYYGLRFGLGMGLSFVLVFAVVRIIEWLFKD